ncbi:hypothetical protein DICPUDRAFT_152794 [Dictyostelium purpureum]|uniref:Phospholipid/glycerol acyltransferase domain-containing protein n=1 Tax=Dictyostelium purpureum TaxID=5786 RepID=F0ZMA5_DICPU|nr:uncharacterized protein DICPUDRAFT_152794 [Dictyostelium purpureum]EGC34925.1 hypothetical protein DICPUDRAFT_152794 [Dictyostelium purpureum]|eukprot:XP_003288558.1 hypothetical protein DICPUDRAFT_152794 [Dictyostelium purpureum]
MSQRKNKISNDEIKQTESSTTIIGEKKIKFESPPHEFIGLRLLRFIAIVLWAITATVIVWMSVPFNYISDPILKKFNVKRRYFLLEFLSRMWGKGLLWIMNIKVITEGLELYDDFKEQPSVLAYSHTSYLDPVILQGYSPIPCKFIFKRELLYIFPMVFLLAHIVGHIPINRKKKHSAIESINEAAEAMIKKDICVAVSPEGTRSKDGNLKEFKKGPFHLSLKSKSNIVPVVFFGNYQLWKSSCFFPYSGTVCIRFLPTIQLEKDDTVESLSGRVRESMLKSLHKPPKNFNPFCETGSSHTIFYLILMGTIIFSTLKFFSII